MFSGRLPVDAGGLMRYGADFKQTYRHAAYFVDAPSGRALRGPVD
jgi:hypothetical protein